MARPMRNKPWLVQVKATYYVAWYDPSARRVRTRSLHTKDIAIAEAALREHPQTYVPAVRHAAKYPWRKWAMKMCRRARSNAKAKNRLCTIDAVFVEGLLAQQGYRCAVSGILLSDAAFRRNPFAPSLDQIEAGGGYTETNCRVVATIVNTAMNEWGADAFWKMVHESRNAAALLSKRISTSALSS